MPLELTVSAGPKTRFRDTPIPTPGDDEVVIKVVVSGSNPKDWKLPQWLNTDRNEGDDIAGVVHQVGKNVRDFRPGDRVAAFHKIGAPHGSYAEYAVAPEHTAFHIPDNISFEEAVTIPLAAGTALVGLYKNLRLPAPWAPATDPTPLLVYGGSTSVGAFVIKLARQADIHPIIAVAGKGASYVETLLDPSKGDAIVDYRKGADAVVQELQTALRKSAPGVSHFPYVFDAVSEHGSVDIIGKVIDPKGAATFVLDYNADVLPPTVRHTRTGVSDVHGDVAATRDLGFVGYRYFGKGLRDGWFSGHPFEVRENGLEGVEAALTDLKNGKASAVKYVFRIADTPQLKA